MSGPGEFDRAGHLRRDEAGLRERRIEETTCLVPVWRNKNFVKDAGPAEPATLTVAEAPALLEAATEVVFLGERDGSAYFGADISAVADPVAELGLAAIGTFRELIAVGSSMARHQVDLLAYARGMFIWHKNEARCGRCGEATLSAEGGHVRECTGCQRKEFPRSDPAVMILVHHEGRVLLARQPTFPPTMFSVLAGFVEPGESIEQCVVREAMEEVGLPVVDLRYIASQPWPFPRSLMLGFACRAERADFVLDAHELEHGRWVTRDELRRPEGFFTPPPISLAHQLLAAFLAGKIG